MIIVNGFQPLTIITKCSIVDAAAVIDPPMVLCHICFILEKGPGEEGRGTWEEGPGVPVITESWKQN